jgi:transcriptional regulator with XRE-family HTH domain
MKEAISKKISSLRKQSGWSQEDLAEKLEIKRSTLSAYEQGRAEPSLNTIHKLSQLFNVNVHDFTGQLEDLMLNSSPIEDKKFRVLAITVSPDEQENIELVNVKAQAGYAGGYGNLEFVKSLPKFRLPFLGQGTYRAFEIEGDSMLPIPSGSIVIGQYVESAKDLRLNDTYIFITAQDGILFKRLVDVTKKQILLKSDNPMYKNYSLPLSDIEEIWKTKLYMSYQFPQPDNTLSQIEQELKSIKKEMVSLGSKVVS